MNPQSLVKKIERKLGVTDMPPDLVLQALRHRSLNVGHTHTPPEFRTKKAQTEGSRDADALRPQEAFPDYERLEFLGDRVWNLCVAEILYHRWPNEREGALAQHLGFLVSQQVLGQIGQRLELGDSIQARDTHITGRPAVVSDVMEALVGSVYLVHGFARTRELVSELIAPYMDQPVDRHKDAKMALQEFAHKCNLEAPVYTMLSRTGDDHAPAFTVAAELGDHQATAIASSKKQAEKDAAAQLLAVLTGQKNHQDPNS